MDTIINTNESPEQDEYQAAVKALSKVKEKYSPIPYEELHFKYKELDPDQDVTTPCIIWGSPKGNLFISHDDNSVPLSLQECLLARIGVLTVNALDKIYNSEPQRG